MRTNTATERYGLALSRQEAELVMAEHREALREQQRIEFGAGITPKIIHMFCDSDFIGQNNYVDMIIRLQEIFYLYKNEMQDEITDDELLNFMKEQFEEVCFGDLEYLESTCLNLFAQAVRAGYRGYERTEGRGDTSISYEKARQLMEAVLYCINELEGKGAGLAAAQRLPAQQAYERGLMLAEEKAREALRLYNEMQPDFFCYGNRCLRDTFMKELPHFFNITM